MHWGVQAVVVQANCSVGIRKVITGFKLLTTLHTYRVFYYPGFVDKMMDSPIQIAICHNRRHCIPFLTLIRTQSSQLENRLTFSEKDAVPSERA